MGWLQMWQVICQSFLSVICLISRREGRFIPRAFLPVQRLTGQSALTNRGAYATDLFLTQRSSEDLRTRRRQSAYKMKTGSFGEFRLTAIRQNHRINKGCRTEPKLLPRSTAGQLTLEQ
jgi:hypothetical protein